MKLLQPLNKRIVCYGMSCVGKTTFAKQLHHKYHCFDALFQWHLIESFGLSIKENFIYINDICKEEEFVIDGWHLSDLKGDFLPKDSTVYLIWSPYKKILSQYRIPVFNYNEFFDMYKKWYSNLKSPSFKIRYILNDGDFVEVNEFDFYKMLNQDLGFLDNV